MVLQGHFVTLVPEALANLNPASASVHAHPLDPPVYPASMLAPPSAPPAEVLTAIPEAGPAQLRASVPPNLAGWAVYNAEPTPRGSDSCSGA